MSVVRCHECDKHIDTDYDSEHFVSEFESIKFAGRCYDSLTDEELENLI